MRVPVAPMTWPEGQDTKQGFPFYPTPLRKHRLEKVAAKGPDHQTKALLAPPQPRPLLDISSGSPENLEGKTAKLGELLKIHILLFLIQPLSPLVHVYVHVCNFLLISSSPHISRSEDHKQKG